MFLNIFYMLDGIILNAMNFIAVKTKMNMDPFAYIKSNSITDNTQIRGMSASAFNLIRAFGIVGVVVSIIVNGIRLMYAKKGQKLEEVKQRIMIHFIISICVFGFITLIGQIFYIAKKSVS